MSDSYRSSQSPRRSSPTRSRRPSTAAPASRRWLVIALGGVVALVALLGIAEASASAGRVHPGVSVAGVEVGGLSQPSARLRIQRELSARMASSPVVFSVGDRAWKATAADVGASVDASGLAGQAMSVGRSGGVFSALADRIGAWTRGVSIPARVTVSDTKSAPFLAALSGRVSIDPTDAVVKIKGPNFTLVPSKQGQGLDKAATQKLLAAGFLGAQRRFEVPTSVVEPAINDAEAKAAIAVARTFVSGNAKVTRGAKTWTFTPQQVAQWVSFRPVGDAGSESLEAYIDPSALKQTTSGMFGKLGTVPQNARFNVSGGHVTIVPSKDGVGPDIPTLASSLSTALAQADGPRAVALKIGRAAPSLTTDKARSYGIKERISTYTTTYGPSNKPRVNNIHQLAKALDGTLIPPGGQFSFNGTVGQRTAEKGYQEAPAIVDGKLVPQLGGGICQVCTTLFNTVFFSGLPVDRRINHQFYISHYPAGRDATVSWGGPDFKFTNDTGHWVLVATGYTRSSVTVSLYGTDPRYDVSYVNGPWTDIRPFKIEEIKDPALPLGSKFVEDGGVEGRSMIVTRTVKKNGVVVRVDRFASNYKPKTETVRIGTKPLPVKPPAETKP